MCCRDRPAIVLLPHAAKRSKDIGDHRGGLRVDNDDMDTFSGNVGDTHAHGQDPGDANSYGVDVGDTDRGSSQSEQNELSVMNTRDSQSQSSFVKISQALSTWLARSPVFGDPLPTPKVTEGETLFLPMVHSLTGSQIQWKIFRKQMASSLPKVCSDLNVDLPLAQDRLTELASHFQ